MKRLGSLLLFLVLLWTGTVHGVDMVSPTEMVEEAEFILAGGVIEVSNADIPELLVEVDTVYRGDIGAAVLRIPLTSSGQFRQEPEIPQAQERLLMFFSLNEAGQLTPMADLNWAGFLEEERVTRLFMGARYHNWDESQYIAAYNEFLAESEPKKIPSAQTDQGEREQERAPTQRPGEVAPSLFLMLAGVAVLLLVFQARIKKTQR
ncbi:hypothetical protein [Dethiobacter alkaliphilus]|uniref:hypothetical protein n=1 Tax=Dethiobacter alkaliphilus TaxID=427926 RepID=UPI00222752A2|nr:hypothetical protein [Dethiobacter alkaliphilus]MCW3488996.1 hypothetical protein [Dethiobacter alkaliphilus]